MFKKLYNNWTHYRRANAKQKYALFHYVVWVLLYRRIVCYVIAACLLPLYFLLYPFVKFRFIKLIGPAIGHYAITTELLLCTLDSLENDRFINVFYLEHSLFEESICNQQLHKMWKRIIFILPLQCSGIVKVLDRFIQYFLANTAYDVWGAKLRYEHRECRDPEGYLKKALPHLAFTAAEEEYGKSKLAELGLKPGEPFVCLQVRSSAYNKNHPTWDFPERNADVFTYMKACRFLAEKGYTVLRMGKVVDNILPKDHPRIIDYANSPVRSDFMDIYLSAHCDFFIGTGTGLDNVPQIFRKPVLYTNFFILPQIPSWYPMHLFIPKRAIFSESQQALTFKEQVYFFLDHPEFRQNCSYEKLPQYTKKVGLKLLDNTEDEILAVVEEMEARLRGTWKESEADQARQAKFWTAWPANAKSIEQYDQTKPLHGEVCVKIGAAFLRQYEDLL